MLAAASRAGSISPAAIAEDCAGTSDLRDARLLILDEPSASLDVRSELKVFKRFSELAYGRWPF